MIVYPNAKINIGLNITSKREDGFHNIESIFYPIPWCDILEINQSSEFKFTTSGLPIEGKVENNLIVRAYNLIKDKYTIPPCHIHLHKQIPMGAGLGGGSADASFTLTTLNTIFDLNISIPDLEAMADSLGSDCPFFIQNTPKYVTGKGEVMADINLDLSGNFIKLINPNIHISTKIAFSGITPIDSNIDLSEVTLNTIKQPNNYLINDFEKSVFPNFKNLKDIKTKISKEDTFYCAMTGTGSTIYGLYEHQPEPTFPEYIEKIIKL